MISGTKLTLSGTNGPAIFVFSVAFSLNSSLSLPVHWSVLLHILKWSLDGRLPFVCTANGDTCVSTFAGYNQRQNRGLRDSYGNCGGHGQNKPEGGHDQHFAIYLYDAPVSYVELEL